MQVEVEVAVESALLAGEAMHDGGGQPVAELPHDGQQAFVGVAFVEEHRFAQFDGQGQLLFQGFFLLRAW
ncbi:hypothetical protein D3C85_1865640 [compost metagenome]